MLQTAFLDDALPGGAAAQEWHQAFKDHWVKDPRSFHLDVVFRDIAHGNRTLPSDIALILLGFRARSSGFDGGIIVQYAATLLKMHIISTSDLLLALLKRSRFSKVPGKPQPSAHGTSATTLEEMLFTLMFQLHLPGIDGEIPLKPRDAPRLLPVIMRWLEAVTEYEMARQIEKPELHAVDSCTFGMYEALASLAITILGSAALRQVVRQPWWETRRPSVIAGMESFDMHVLQWMQSRFANSLRALIKLPPFLEIGEHGKPIFSEQQIMDSIMDLPIARSRAGLYVWLNACLCGRPFTEDMSMLAYLQARHPGDNQSLAVDLQIAAFDVLTNALLRKEPRQNVRLIRSFICNKVPHLLAMLAGFMSPMAVEACVQMAFISITVDALPPISAGATEVREMLKRTRVEYLQACALYGLITENSIGAILQEQSGVLPKTTRYTKEGLVAQCNNNLGRLDTLAEELHNMHGNAAAIVGCIVDMISIFCVNKDTMSLRAVCNALLKRMPDMDVVVLFAQPASVVGPLCVLLNDWVHDQDQTEFTPSYEEFAAILLFTLAFLHRYGLGKAELGIPLVSGGFVFQLQRDISSNLSPSELTTEQNEQLSQWIEGLFSPDEHGETSSISEEVMRQCPPQAFYLLVPTLFDQSVLACSCNALSISTFKGGLELLLEPFLLPSLLGGLTWLVKHSWEDHGDVDILLQTLEKLLKPSSRAPETLAMHKAVLGVVADPLVNSLQDLLRKLPDKTDANALVELLKPYRGQRRTHSKTLEELEEWSTTTDGGLAQLLRTTIRDLVNWMSSVGHSPPPKYTHVLFTTACQVLGADGVLQAIIAELKSQTVLNNGPVALDICAALICAPTPSSPGMVLGALPGSSMPSAGAPLSVRDTLKLTVSDIKALIQRTAGNAEAIVRLSHRVEAQMAAQQVPQMPLTLATQDEATDQIIKDLGLDDGATGAALLPQPSSIAFPNDDLTAGLEQSMSLEAAAHELESLAADPGAMEIDFADLGMSMGPSTGTNANTNNGQQQNAEDDIFADLDMDVGDLGDDFQFT